MRWAEIVAQGSLDDSRDGLNLMIKQTLQVGNNVEKKLSEIEEQHPLDVKEDDTASDSEVKAKSFSWKDVLVGKQQEKFESVYINDDDNARDGSEELDTITLPQFETTSNGFSTRKRLAKEMEKAEESVKPEKEQRKEVIQAKVPKADHIDKRRKKNDPPVNVSAVLKEIKSVKSPLFVKRIKSWASDSEDDSSDEDYAESVLTRDGDNEDGISVSTPLEKRQNQMEVLTEKRISKRQRQLDIGKSTPGYHNYVKRVPKDSRVAGDYRHPVTPDKELEVSKRQWDVHVRSWRRALHMYDDPELVTVNVFKTKRAPRSRKKQPKKNAAMGAPPKSIQKVFDLQVNLGEFPQL